MASPTPFPRSGLPGIVRDAAEDDFRAITAIYSYFVETSAATFELIAPDAEEMLRRYRELTDQGLPYLVAEDQEGRVIGYAYAGRYRSRPGYRYTVEDSVYVDKDFLGRSIGRLLLTALIERVTALGYRQMISVIGDSANTASIALHSQLGFKVIGALPSTGRKFDRWIDSVLMQLALGDGNSTPPN